MRLAISALALVATATSSLAATDAELKTNLVGHWSTMPVCSQGSLTFNADGTFSINDGDPAGGDPKGTYAVTNGSLTGQAGDITMDPVIISFNGDKLVMADPAAPTVPVATFVHCT